MGIDKFARKNKQLNNPGTSILINKIKKIENETTDMKKTIENLKMDFNKDIERSNEKILKTIENLRTDTQKDIKKIIDMTKIIENLKINIHRGIQKNNERINSFNKSISSIEKRIHDIELNKLFKYSPL